MNDRNGVRWHGEPADEFTDAVQRVLGALRRRLPMGVWLLARRQGDDYRILAADDEAYGIEAGLVLKWDEPLCAHMVDGSPPAVAPDVMAVEAYAQAPVRQAFPIGAYIGAPIVLEDGEVFATLCALDPEPQDESLRELLPEVQLFATLLSTILTGELRSQGDVRRAERAEQQAMLDPLTGVGNRRMWDRMVNSEEARCARYGSTASVVLVDLDNLKEVNDRGGHRAGDELLRRVAGAITVTVRSGDVVARLGGDEFGVLAVPCGQAEASELAVRLRAMLDESKIQASIGVGTRALDSSLPTAGRVADGAMYAEKAAASREEPGAGLSRFSAPRVTGILRIGAPGTRRGSRRRRT